MLQTALSFLSRCIHASKAVTLFDDGMALCNSGKHAEGAPLLREAAELGYLNAMAIYGSMCLFGQGVPMNGKDALRWLEAAVEGGHADAKSVLGMVLATGKAGIKKDIPRATTLLTQCAANGDQQAKRMLETLA